MNAKGLDSLMPGAFVANYARPRRFEVRAHLVSSFRNSVCLFNVFSICFQFFSYYSSYLFSYLCHFFIFLFPSLLLSSSTRLRAHLAFSFRNSVCLFNLFSICFQFFSYYSSYLFTYLCHLFIFSSPCLLLSSSTRLRTHLDFSFCNRVCLFHIFSIFFQFFGY